MPLAGTNINFEDQLNRAAPAFAAAKVGTTLKELIIGHNALRADTIALRTAFNTAMTKLNADAGVTDTNYAAVGALTAVAVGNLGTR